MGGGGKPEARAEAEEEIPVSAPRTASAGQVFPLIGLITVITSYQQIVQGRFHGFDFSLTLLKFLNNWQR